MATVVTSGAAPPAPVPVLDETAQTDTYAHLYNVHIVYTPLIDTWVCTLIRTHSSYIRTHTLEQRFAVSLPVYNVL